MRPGIRFFQSTLPLRPARRYTKLSCEIATTWPPASKTCEISPPLLNFQYGLSEPLVKRVTLPRPSPTIEAPSAVSARAVALRADFRVDSISPVTSDTTDNSPEAAATMALLPVKTGSSTKLSAIWRFHFGVPFLV